MREFPIHWPAMGIYKPVWVKADNLYEAKVKASAKRGLLKPGIPRAYVTVAAKVDLNAKRRRFG